MYVYICARGLTIDNRFQIWGGDECILWLSSLNKKHSGKVVGHSLHRQFEGALIEKFSWVIEMSKKSIFCLGGGGDSSLPVEPISFANVGALNLYNLSVQSSAPIGQVLRQRFSENVLVANRLQHHSHCSNLSTAMPCL
jgi:hypothetical protein